MSTTPPPTRRLAIAITAAVSSITLAIGVTAASMLGWFRPVRTAEPPPPATTAPAAPAATSPVILVPIESAAPAPAYAPERDTQVAMHHEDDEHHGDDEHEDDDD